MQPNHQFSIKIHNKVIKYNRLHKNALLLNQSGSNKITELNIMRQQHEITSLLIAASTHRPSKGTSNPSSIDNNNINLSDLPNNRKIQTKNRFQKNCPNSFNMSFINFAAQIDHHLDCSLLLTKGRKPLFGSFLLFALLIITVPLPAQTAANNFSSSPTQAPYHLELHHRHSVQSDEPSKHEQAQHDQPTIFQYSNHPLYYNTYLTWSGM